MQKLRYLPLTAIVAAILLVTGCHPNPGPMTGISPEQTQCAQRCQSQLNRCTKQYNKIYQQCLYQARQQAKMNYTTYLQQQHKQHQSPTRTLPDFLNTTHCQQQLTCKADYVLCVKQCGL